MLLLLLLGSYCCAAAVWVAPRVWWALARRTATAAAGAAGAVSTACSILSTLVVLRSSSSPEPPFSRQCAPVNHCDALPAKRPVRVAVPPEAGRHSAHSDQAACYKRRKRAKRWENNMTFDIPSAASPPIQIGPPVSLSALPRHSLRCWSHHRRWATQPILASTLTCPVPSPLPTLRPALALPSALPSA